MARPDDALLHVDLSAVLPGSQGDPGWNAAIAEDRDVVRLDPDEPHAWNHPARVLENVGDWDGAMPAYKEAMARKPDDAFFHKELAELLEKKGDLDGAVTEAREAIPIAPDRVGVHLALAKILRRQGDKVGAAKERRMAIALQANNPPRRIRVGGVVMSNSFIIPGRPIPARRKRQASRGPYAWK